MTAIKSHECIPLVIQRINEKIKGLSKYDVDAYLAEDFLQRTSKIVEFGSFPSDEVFRKNIVCFCTLIAKEFVAHSEHRIIPEVNAIYSILRPAMNCRNVVRIKAALEKLSERFETHSISWMELCLKVPPSEEHDHTYGDCYYIPLLLEQIRCIVEILKAYLNGDLEMLATLLANAIGKGRDPILCFKALIWGPVIF